MMFEIFSGSKLLAVVLFLIATPFFTKMSLDSLKENPDEKPYIYIYKKAKNGSVMAWLTIVFSISAFIYGVVFLFLNIFMLVYMLFL